MKLLALLISFHCISFIATAGDAPIPDCPEAAPQISAPGGHGQIMQATMYDDGNSCPENCAKSHVVFDPRHNGTSNAFDPKTSHPAATPPKFEKCQLHKNCRICFRDNADCLEIKYEGSGPPAGKFDFPVAFFEANCKRKNMPPQILSECPDPEKMKAKFAGRVNCFQDPTNKNCLYLMQRRLEEQNADAPAYAACKSSGLAAFNATAQEGRKRSHDCDYSEKKSPFPSKNAGVACYKYWFMLMPGVCPKGSLVGKFGLNCCRGDEFWAAALGADCEEYFPKQEF